VIEIPEDIKKQFLSGIDDASSDYDRIVALQAAVDWLFVSRQEELTLASNYGSSLSKLHYEQRLKRAEELLEMCLSDEGNWYAKTIKVEQFLESKP